MQRSFEFSGLAGNSRGFFCAICMFWRCQNDRLHNFFCQEMFWAALDLEISLDFVCHFRSVFILPVLSDVC